MSNRIVAVQEYDATIATVGRTLGTVLDAMQSLREEDLLKTIAIRSQPLIVIDAINRQLAHYSYHVGQIVYLGRWMKENQWQSLSIPKKAKNN